jgi:hypothetical protein
VSTKLKAFTGVNFQKIINTVKLKRLITNW